MCKKLVLLLAYVCVLTFAGTASSAPPVLLWQNTLENDSTSTVDGGEIINPPSSYVSGAKGNAFAGNGSVYAEWDNTDVETIFDGVWDNDAGSTIDLYFRGDHWDTHSGDSGFWAVFDRLDGNDGHIIVSVRDGKLRFPYRDSYTNYGNAPHLTGITLANNTTYRLTVRQYENNFEVYLDGGAYSNSSPVYTDNTWSETIAFPEYNTLTPGRDMYVAQRSDTFGGILQNGEWVDHIRVYNGFYSPAELDIPYASNPVPEHDEINVSPDAVLNWDAPDPNLLNDLPARYNVYFGTEPNETHPNFDFPLVSENQLETFHDPLGGGVLEELTDYYWRIDVVDPNFGEAKVYTGDLWHFTTIPPKATEPFPDDDATGVAQNVVLSWTPGYEAISHNVYISTILSEVENGTADMVNRTVNNYDPDLDWETEYFWRVDEVFDDGVGPPGDIWSFTTGTPECEYELGGDFDNNCIVDLRDVAIMVGNWLECNLVNGDCPY